MDGRIQILKGGRAVPILQPVPEVSSTKSPWQGILLEKHLAAAGEVPECTQADHLLGLNYPCDEQSYPRFRWRVEGRERECVGRPGYLCLVPHGTHYSSSWSGAVTVLITTLSPVLIEWVADEARIARDAELVPDVDAHDDLIEHIILALHDELVADCPAGRLYGESLAIALAAHLLTKYSARKFTDYEYKGGLTPNKLRRILDYINDNLTEDVALASLAEAVGMNQYHLARSFKQTTGLAPHQYMIRQRIEQAKRLLKTTELPIIEVCFRCGFNNQSHFTKSFRRSTGATPKAFRDSC